MKQTVITCDMCNEDGDPEEVGAYFGELEDALAHGWYHSESDDVIAHACPSCVEAMDHEGVAP